MLAARRDGPDVRGLQNRRDVGSANGAAAMIGIENDCLKGSLAEPVGRKARGAEYRAGPVPGLAEVKRYLDAQELMEKLSEVRGNGLLGKVVALALDDVAGKV